MVKLDLSQILSHCRRLLLTYTQLRRAFLSKPLCSTRMLKGFKFWVTFMTVSEVTLLRHDVFDYVIAIFVLLE